MRAYTEEFNPTPVIATPIPAGAGFGIRLGARGIDFAFSMFLGLAGGFFGGIALAVMAELGHAPENWHELVGKNSYWGYVFGVLGTVLYGWIAEGIGGTTLGKVCLGLHVVHLDGQPCGFFAGFKRNLAYLMDALFFGLVGYDSMKKTTLNQRHGDHWAKTVVVKKSIFLPTPPVPAWKITLGILLGAGLWTASQVAQLFTAVFSA